jgi:hypothetical protein
VSGTTWSSPSRCGLQYEGDGHLSAQTERRGDAVPVRGLLSGKDLTGRCLSCDQPPLRIMSKLRCSGISMLLPGAEEAMSSHLEYLWHC